MKVRIGFVLLLMFSPKFEYSKCFLTHKTQPALQTQSFGSLGVAALDKNFNGFTGGWDDQVVLG